MSFGPAGSQAGAHLLMKGSMPEAIAAGWGFSYPGGVRREALEHYLADGSRRGPVPSGAFSGAAGGAACGDLARISLTIADGEVTGATFDAPVASSCP